MKLGVLLFLSRWLFLCNRYNFMLTKALVGENVQPAAEGQFTFAACITDRLSQRVLLENNIICTGAAITKTHILTSAHCTLCKLLNETQIIIGSVNVRNGRIYYPVWWISFNTWCAMRNRRLEFESNDIAVIKLAQEISDEVILGAISPLKIADLYGQNVTALGWGVTSSGNASLILQTADVNLLSNSECKQRVSATHGAPVFVHFRHLCTVSDPYTLVHSGDSGGPLVLENMIIGVNEATMPHPELHIHPDKVNIHVSTYHYRHFIQHVTNPLFSWY